MDQAERTTILVVEDEALIRMISADILEEAGFRVLEAANAAEAILIMEGADTSNCCLPTSGCRDAWMTLSSGHSFRLIGLTSIYSSRRAVSSSPIARSRMVGAS